MRNPYSSLDFARLCVETGSFKFFNEELKIKILKVVVREEVVFLNLSRLEDRGWRLAFYQDFEQGKLPGKVGVVDLGEKGKAAAG